MRFQFRSQGSPSRSGGSDALLANASRAFWLTSVIIFLVFLFIILGVLRGIYTNWLWYESLGFLDLYTRILTTRLWLFFGGAALSGVLTGINLYLAYRLSKGISRIALPETTALWVRRVTILAIVFIVAIISIGFGVAASGRWETVLLAINSVPFNITDPVYNTDVSFYVFKVRLFHFVQGWLLGVGIINILATLAVYSVRFSLRGTRFTLEKSVRTHLTVIGALTFFCIGWGHFLDTYEILLSPGGLVSGATYTDIAARRPALLLLTSIAGLSGVILFASILLKEPQRWLRLAVGATGLWIVAAILVGAVYPALIQRFVVEPNELERETPYIERNIEWTRMGFGLDQVTEAAYPVKDEVPPEVFLANPETTSNIRLWDPRPLTDVYNQKQHLALYYEFLNLDVDRYQIDGEYRQVLLGARELAPEKLPSEAQRWSNQKLQFTHGYGVVMSPATEHTQSGNPTFYIRDVPPQGKISVDTPQVYYGENNQSFVIVKTKVQEFDRPSYESTPVYKPYAGNGGVALGSILRRMAYAWEFTDINILISGQLTPESRIQYRRNIQDRVNAVVPFLRLDKDPYLVIVNGKLYWIQDAYTTTDRFPYSQRPEGVFNYVRNSVKIVVDAHDGTVQMYITDDEDPLLRAYAKIFPGIFLPSTAMDPGIQEHIRYPQDLFEWQSHIYLQYHMTDPQVFFNKEDQWGIPSEVFFGAIAPLEPYRVIMKLPGEESAEFVLLLPFTPAKKPNMVAWLAARNDRPHYGELVLFRFPKDRQIDGPSQIEARIDNDPYIAQQFTLWGQAGSTVVRGKLLVIPIGGTILYAEPIYLQASGLKFPQLKRVILATQDEVVMEESLEDSLAALVRKEPLKSPTLPVDLRTAADDLSRKELNQKIRALLEIIQALQEDFSYVEKTLEGLENQTQVNSK